MYLLLGGIAVGVPTLAWFVRRARGRNGRKHNAATIRGKFARAHSVDDFTPEQTAVLRRVREIWDTLGGQASADLQQVTG